MTRVRVVEPVVVVRDVVGTALRLHAEHVGLAGIPEAVVRDGDEFRVALHVDLSVALIVVTATMLTVEHIHVVNPDVRVVGVERDTVVHAAHNAEITEFNALGVAYQKAKATDGGIVTNTLEGDVQLRVCSLALYLNALFFTADFVEVVFFDKPDEAESNRRGVIALLVALDNSLQTSTLRRATLTIGDNRGLDGLRRIVGDIEHLSP